MRLDNSTQYRVSGNVGGQHMCLRDAMAKGFDGFSTSAAEHGWRPLTFPPALLRSLTLRKGDKRSKGDPVPASFNDAASIRSPLSRRAGAGLGVRVVPHLPLSPFLSPTKRGRENVGAGEKERWKPEFDPILSERWETRGLARKNAGNPSRHSHTGTVRAQ